MREVWGCRGYAGGAREEGQEPTLMSCVQAGRARLAGVRGCPGSEGLDVQPLQLL